MRSSQRPAVGSSDWLGLSSLERYVMAADYLDVSQLPLAFHAIENEKLFCLVVWRRKTAVRNTDHVTALHMDMINGLRSTASFTQTLLRECDNRAYVAAGNAVNLSID